MVYQQLKRLSLLLSLLLSVTLYGQTAYVNESGEVIYPAATTANIDYKTCSCPEDEICKKTVKRAVLAHPHIEERDVLWEKRIWQEINLNQKQNQHFAAAKQPFISILLEAAKKGALTVYHPLDDEFSTAMTIDEVNSLGGGYDTVMSYDPITYQDSFVVVFNELNPNDIQGYRIKEVWYFDSKYSTMKVRILGIAPIITRYDDNGRKIAETPLFWAYYPDIRVELAQHKVYNPFNDASQMSWEDVFEARIFTGQITKESNMHDRRIQDYASGVDALLEAERIKNKIRNFEDDQWTH